MSASTFGHFLVEPRALGGEVDHALERQRRRPRRAPASCTEPCGGASANEMSDDARQPLARTRPSARRAPCVSARRADQHQRDRRAVMFISARTERIAVTRSITQPISASALSSSSPSSFGQSRQHQQRVALRPRLAGDAPQLLGDERHERVQQLQDFVEHPGRRRARLVLRRAIRPGQHRLRQFDVPVAIDVPDEAIGRAGRLVELVGLDRLGDLARRPSRSRARSSG